VDDQHFEKPVQVRLGSGGRVQVVHTAKEAAECLVKYRWPRATGVKHRRARKACLDVLSGLKNAVAAQKAFEAAAIESDILVSGQMLRSTTLEDKQS
jgi:hypothetical protein